MKVGDLVEWKPAPGFPAIVVQAVDEGEWGGTTLDLLFGVVPEKLNPIAESGIVRGFGPWELKVINESR